MQVDATCVASEVSVNTEDEIPRDTFSTCCLLFILHSCRIIQSSSGPLNFVRKAEPMRKTIKKTAFLDLAILLSVTSKELGRQSPHRS